MRWRRRRCRDARVTRGQGLTPRRRERRRRVGRVPRRRWSMVRAIIIVERERGNGRVGERGEKVPVA